MEELLAAVKNYLNITWEDELTDQKLQGMIERGKSYLNHISGGSFSFAEENEARALLFDYCRYVWSNALEEFEQNFKPHLLALRIAAVTEMSREQEREHEQKEDGMLQ